MAFDSENVFAQSNVSSCRWMEQQHKKCDGSVRWVREERPAADHWMSADSRRWCMGLYQLAEIRWSGCGPHLVSQCNEDCL